MPSASYAFFDLRCQQIQLRIRDRIQTSMEEFSRNCLEIDEEAPTTHPKSGESTPTPTEPQYHQPLSQDVVALITNGDSYHPEGVPTEQSTPTQEDHKRPTTSIGTSRHLHSTMDKVYTDAARLIQKTLDVEGVFVMDVSHCDVLEPTKSFESTSAPVSEPSSASSSTPSLERRGHRPSKSFASDAAASTVSVTLYYGDPKSETQTQTLTRDEYIRLAEFFSKYPDGQVFDGVVPLGFRAFLPGRVNYALSKLFPCLQMKWN